MTLSDHLAGRKLLDAVGGPVFLAEIADFEATAAHVIHHARIVRDKAVKRRLIQVATGVVESVYEDEGSSGSLLDAAESRSSTSAAPRAAAPSAASTTRWSRPSTTSRRS